MSQHFGAMDPGWYPDPKGPGERYWDGHGWTDQTRAMVISLPAKKAPAKPAPEADTNASDPNAD